MNVLLVEVATLKVDAAQDADREAEKSKHNLPHDEHLRIHETFLVFSSRETLTSSLPHSGHLAWRSVSNVPVVSL